MENSRPKVESKSDLIPGLIDDINIFRINPPKIPLRSNLTSIEELALSINEKGLLQPIIVRSDSNGCFEIVAGNRRYNASKSLGWRKIPCHVVELDDKEAFEISLIENIQHETLNPLEEAKAFKAYVDDYGWGGVRELANRIGKSPTYISRRIKLLKLPKDIQEQIVAERNNLSLAQELLSYDEDTSKELFELARKNDLTSTAVRRIKKKIDERTIEDFDSKVKQKHELDIREAVLKKSISLMKLTLVKFDDIIGTSVLEEDWVFKETMMHYRKNIHELIDSLIHVRSKMTH